VHSLQLVGWSTLWMALGLLIIAAVDVPVQLWESHKKLLMTKQEVRDEHKDSEGRPEVKQRIRQLQREMSQRRMMTAIPDADVIITNPTHYAVALKYDAERGGAPILLAKGSDFMALKIREIAAQHEILLLQSPALARSIYYSTELDQEIPAGLYLAVAQVLAYVYQIRQYQAGRGKRPDPLKDNLPIPPDLRRDS
jgi:flagellar biosynthetic protein FlhB